MALWICTNMPNKRTVHYLDVCRRDNSSSLWRWRHHRHSAFSGTVQNLFPQGVDPSTDLESRSKLYGHGCHQMVLLQQQQCLPIDFLLPELIGILLAAGQAPHELVHIQNLQECSIAVDIATTSAERVQWAWTTGMERCHCYKSRNIPPKKKWGWPDLPQPRGSVIIPRNSIATKTWNTKWIRDFKNSNITSFILYQNCWIIYVLTKNKRNMDISCNKKYLINKTDQIKN